MAASLSEKYVVDNANAALLTRTGTEIAAMVRGSPVTQAISGAGAIALASGVVDLTTPASSSYAVTLAAPDVTGREMIIEAVNTGGGTVTLALTNVQGGTAATTATFTNVNDTLVLKAGKNKWNVIKQVGVVLS